MKNAKFSTFDVKRCCEHKLGIGFRAGKEFNGWFFLNQRKVARITIPKGRKPIPRKTYSSMARQLKLSVEEFDDLLECPLNGQGYGEVVAGRMS